MQIAECKHGGAYWSLELLLLLCHENENQNYSELVKTRRENKTPNFQPTLQCRHLPRRYASLFYRDIFPELVNFIQRA